MFPVTYVEKENEIIIPVIYYNYKPVKVIIVTKKIRTGTINGVAQYRYETEEKTYYIREQELSSNVEIEIEAYTKINVSIPTYSDKKISGKQTVEYYEPAGKETLTPTKKTVKYLECTIHPFDNSVISNAFGLDLNASYNSYGTTYGEVIQTRAHALKQLLYGTEKNKIVTSVSDNGLIAFLNQQNCNETRRHILKTALSLVGKVPYF